MLSTRVNICKILCCVMLMLWTCQAQAQDASKEAILLVAFGTSVKKAQVSYANIEKHVRAAFPHTSVHWAWTAHSLLKSAPHITRLSVQEALAKLATDGVKKVYILSLHIIPGLEYAHLVQTARAFEGLPKGIEHIRISQPLLHNTHSVHTIAEILLHNAPKERTSGDALIFVGHGTHHAAGVYYMALQHALHKLDKNAFVCTVDNSTERESILHDLKAKGIQKVWLMPFMTVAGDHTLKDLFGAEKDSWKSVLTANGMYVETVSKGLGEYPSLVEQWVRNLKIIVH